MVGDYIETYYNQQRLRQTLGYQSPAAEAALHVPKRTSRISRPPQVWQMGTASSVSSNVLVLKLSLCPFVRPDPGFLSSFDDRLEVLEEPVGHLVPGIRQRVTP